MRILLVADEEAALLIEDSAWEDTLRLDLVKPDFQRRFQSRFFYLVVPRDFRGIRLVDEIVLDAILHGQGSAPPTLEVLPPQPYLVARWIHISQVDFLLLLGVDEGVAQEQLFAFQVSVVLANVVPGDRHAPQVPPAQPMLELAQLPDKGHSYLQVRAP